jgi:hypothetical protein
VPDRSIDRQKYLSRFKSISRPTGEFSSATLTGQTKNKSGRHNASSPNFLEKLAEKFLVFGFLPKSVSVCMGKLDKWHFFSFFFTHRKPKKSRFSVYACFSPEVASHFQRDMHCISRT